MSERSDKSSVLTSILAGIFAAAVVVGIWALLAWILSVSLTFIFGIDVGFWKSFAIMAVIYIIGALFNATRKGS